ncbi:MAG: tetratricopeptide repeat protein [Elusimicrobia bacterium]|nr:tetratricopeptide repeat protein [Elusimicrobiota bacterium]
MKSLLVLGMGLLLCEPAAAQKSKAPSRRADTESLFLDMSKINLGTITTEEDRKKYLYTIQLEKARITRKTLRAVYENAYDLYRAGDYEGTREMTARILAIDPGFEDAAILQRASIELKGSRRPFISEKKLIEDKFDEGMALYRQGRVVEASERWEEAVKLAPGNLKARYWLKKSRGEIADEHFRRGQKAYRQHRLREALDQWYAALVLNPRYPRLVGAISKVESELRQADSNEKLQSALNLYAQGKTDEALKALDQVLQVEPGDSRAQKLIAEIRLEVANQHVAEGRRLYEARKYTQAMAEWKKATSYGYDPRAADRLVARAKDQMRREADAKKRAEEERQRREDEARRKAEEDARRLEDEKRKAEEEAKRLELEAAAKSAPKGPSGPLGSPAAASENDKRQAVQYWNSGIIFYQKGDYEKAREEWQRCKQLDPSNSDCITGLQRIDQSYGTPP